MNMADSDQKPGLGVFMPQYVDFYHCTPASMFRFHETRIRAYAGF